MPEEKQARVPGFDDEPIGSDGRGGVVVLTPDEAAESAKKRNAEEAEYLADEKAARR